MIRPLTPAEIAADKLEQKAKELLLLADELRASAPRRKKQNTKPTNPMEFLGFVGTKRVR